MIILMIVMVLFSDKAPETGLGDALSEEKQMNDMQRFEERFVEAMVDLWVRDDAPQWIRDYVREEFKKAGRSVKWGNDRKCIIVDDE